ncbi:MAG: ribonuclease HII [Deltaproteobacteria bacterium]|nr:ribonuclease HII [Deltaproteobacteria bacterium]
MSDLSLEASLKRDGYQCVAGVDEAGRGPLAGPVVVAAVVMPESWPDDVPLDDSKKLSPRQREAAFEAIRKNSRGYRIKVVPPGEIDRLNILAATLAGMARALEELVPRPDMALVDGNSLPRVSMECRAIVGGDGISHSIAAASILAKVVRDRIMAAYGRLYPGWGFDRHKGYPTRDHREAVLKLGRSPIHRLSFRVRGLDGP